MPAAFARLKVMARRLEWSEWAVWFGCGAFLAYSCATSGLWILGVLAALLLGAGCAQLFARAWAWHVGLAAYGAVTLLAFAGIWFKGFTIWGVAMAVGCAWASWSHYRGRARFIALAENADGEERGPKHSLVLWLRDPLYLDASILGDIAARAYGVPFNAGEECECFVVGKGMHYVMRVQDAFFLINYWEAPYFNDPEAAAESLRELRRATAVREHRAWLSVDFMHAGGELSEPKIYDAIGRLLAEISVSAPELLAVFHPATGRIAPWDSELREKLAGGEPLAVFTEPVNVPVIQVESSSPALAAAVAEARRRWPEFLAAYEAATDKERFSVKAPVTEGGNTEFIWIKVKAIAGDQIHGFLANDPVALGDLRLGAFVTVDVGELNDWVCPDPAAPDQPLGLFTVKAVSEAGRR